MGRLICYNMEELIEMKKVRKIIVRILLFMLVGLFLFVLGTFIFHRVKTKQALKLLKEKGYYNPVSVGDYSLNVAKFGNANGAHTIVGLAGLGSGDYAVGARQMTACLEEDNQVVFVDRAGYGFSGDTDHDMTLEYIVEDYRTALKNAGIEAPYILMPHSIGGAYANYWVNHYPEEIEAVVFVDGSQLSADAFEEEKADTVGLDNKILALLAKLGFSRYVLRDYFYHYPDNYTEEEQYLGDELMLLTMDSLATVSEECNLAANAQAAFNDIIANDVPKLYICASWGIQTEEELVEYSKWINRQIEINEFDMKLRRTEYDDEQLEKILKTYEDARQETLYPYIEKMGNCKLVCLGGDHMIYEQKPDQCGEIISAFLDELDN
ncbi:MAG: alpha/beta hydrolase [Ruminococcus sp.]|nr:alpha/beta hydrolase [Ruminococcus sp.]